MEAYLFNSRKVEFSLSTKLNIINGDFKIEEDLGLQPFGSIGSANKDTAKIGIRIILKLKDLLTFVSETDCIINFSNPENENEIFMDLTNKSISQHYAIFNKEKLGTSVERTTLRQYSDDEKNQICQLLIQYFRSTF